MGFKMKVIFQDWDGVLVPFGKASLSDKAVGRAVDNFKALLAKEPTMKIVLSTAWRQHGMAYCKRFLDGLGINPDLVIGMTGDERGSRGHQIQLYLNRHPEVTKFVIVDDNSDMGDLTHKLVKTNSFVGFTEKDIDLAVEILNKS
jgi:hypothetical protein